MKINGTQVMGLEYVRRGSYVHTRTLAALVRRGLVRADVAALTAQGEVVYDKAYQRHLLGGRVEYKRVYTF